jgi:hypothetical protein
MGHTDELLSAVRLLRKSCAFSVPEVVFLGRIFNFMAQNGRLAGGADWLLRHDVLHNRNSWLGITDIKKYAVRDMSGTQTTVCNPWLRAAKEIMPWHVQHISCAQSRFSCLSTNGNCYCDSNLTYFCSSYLIVLAHVSLHVQVQTCAHIKTRSYYLGV